MVPASAKRVENGITDREESIAQASQRVGEITASGMPLRQTLEEIVRTIEGSTASGMIASILILSDDGRHLRHGAGPSLPEAYNAAIDGIEIGPEVGSCGTAAYEGKTVAVYDIATSPLWANFKDLALAHGLRACWSTPIRGSDGSVLGTFANYYRIVRDPSPTDEKLTNLITHAAATAIENDRK